MPKKENSISSDLPAIRERVRKYIFKANCKGAVKYLRAWQKVYPKDLFILSALATLPYEGEFAFPGPRRDRAYKKAAQGLKPLLRKMRGLPIESRFRNRNEYYWFSQQHLKQYKLGLEGVRKGLVRSYYSQGVGASNLAYQILSKNPQSKKGLQWARRAEKAWLQYFRLWSRKYYDPWAWYALSLGLQGRHQEMEKALKRSAQLAGISYRNNRFLNEIRDMVKRSLIEKS